MTENVERITVSVEKELLQKFDLLITKNAYSNRSKAVSDALRAFLMAEEIADENAIVSGIISYTYDHHKAVTNRKLLDIRHAFKDLIRSANDMHLKEHGSLQVIMASGKAKEVLQLAQQIQTAKGVNRLKISLFAVR